MYMPNDEQEIAYKKLNSGHNIFLTGGAGVGKTYIINKFIQDKQKQGFNVMVTAPTGVASGNVNGVTLHQAFKMPLGAILKRDIQSIGNVERECDEVLNNTDILIIEEISMCRIDMFEYVAVSILKANRERKRQGKPVIQLIAVGDFFQLMPVISKYDKYILEREYEDFSESGLAFYSKYWAMFKFRTVLLTKVMRQRDKEFTEKLNRLRMGERIYIEDIYEMSSKERTNGITICGLNQEVDRINKENLSSLPDELVYYTAEYIGDVTEKDVIADDVLYIKVGARVMLIVNSEDGAYVNGSMGEVKALYSDAIVVELDSRGQYGKEQVVVKQYNFDVYTYKIDAHTHHIAREKVGTVRQFPIKLGYAVTIHKSQGQTYEKANISPYCWECGQLYVAISRVISPSNLYFNYKPSIYDTFTASNVLKFYREAIANTEQAEQAEQAEGETEQEERVRQVGQQDNQNEQYTFNSQLVQNNKGAYSDLQSITEKFKFI